MIDKEVIHKITDEEIDENLTLGFTGQIIVAINCRNGSIAKVQTETTRKREYINKST